MKPKKLIFISPHDPQNILNWSGSLYFLYKALQQNSAGIQIRSISVGLADRAARALAKVFWRVGIKIDLRSTTLFALLKGVELTFRTMFIKEAVIVAVIAANDIAYLKTRKKIIYLTDATFEATMKLLLTNAVLASRFKDAFPNWLRVQCERNEFRTLKKAQYAIFSSKWASDSAKLHYGLPEDRVFDLPFGPNIPEHLINEAYASKTISPASEVRFVFVSADWSRKNGDKALEICRHLIRAGVKARLVTIGHTAEHAKRLEFVEDLGFLRKSEPAQLAKLCQAYREAHFLLLPSNADAFGVVFTEAQAFGVPPIGCDVGGIGSAIRHKETGLLLPVDAPAEKFAQEILPYIKNSRLYTELSQRCRAWYLQKANWANWSKLIIQLAIK